ncbi:MAG: hypothetical protein ACRCR9_01675 [Chitinophagaceae bacterium]
MIGTTWREIGDFPEDYTYARILTFLADTTFAPSFTSLRDSESPPTSRISTWSHGTKTTDTLGWIKNKFIYDYKDGTGNIICKRSNFNSS